MRRLSSRQVAASSMSGLATGYLWRTVSVQRSLVASQVTCRIFPTSDDDKSRQNRQIRREIRKKIFRDKFFSDANLSESVQNFLITIGKISTSRWPGLSNEAHVTCLRQWESTSDKIGVWHAQLRTCDNYFLFPEACLDKRISLSICRLNPRQSIAIKWVFL